MSLIRPATATDAAAIAEIWNPVIRDSAITFTTIEKTPQMIAALITDAPGFLVLEEGHATAGFALFAPFRAGPGYAATVEHTIILAPQARGHGQGAVLLGALEDLARAQDKHIMVAGIATENRAAIAFHVSRGYQITAQMPAVGRKFDRWLDLVLMQKTL